MDPVVFLTALGSAVLHAGWNAAARRRSDPGEGLAVVLYAASLAAVPLLMITGLPARVAWPWLAGGLVANIISARTLMAAYRREGRTEPLPFGVHAAVVQPGRVRVGDAVRPLPVPVRA